MSYTSVFRELQYEIWKVAFLSAFLNGALAFFASNVVLTFLRERPIYSLVPAIIVFVWSFVRTVRKYTLKRIEQDNPEVAEILRTAHDNSSGDNLMVHALFMDLMQKMETVSAGAFLSSTKLFASLIAIGVLAAAPVAIHQCEAYCTIDNPFDGYSFQDALTDPDSPLAPILPIAQEGERDIYGERDVLQLGNEKLDITAASSAGGVDFTTTDEAGGNRFRSNDYPVQAEAEQTEAGKGGAYDPIAACNFCLRQGKTTEQCQAEQAC
jgi:hypothetical protein